MSETRLFYLLLAGLISFSTMIQADDSFKDFQRQQKAQYQQFVAEDTAAYERFKAEVRSKWREFLESTQNEWVSYNGDLDRSSRVDFRKGVIIIEALVETHSEGDMNEARRKVLEQVLYLLSPDNPAGISVLADQLAMSDGTPVTDEKRKQFAEQAAQGTQKTVGHFQGEDGVDRMRVRLEIPLVPDHFQRRAALYQPLVRKYSDLFNVDVATVMSLISVESGFNPMAVSQNKRIGLMQIDPTSEVLKMNLSQEVDSTALNTAFLYSPENNIRLGCAYLGSLKEKHFAAVRDRERQRYLLIATYYAGASGNRQWFKNLDAVGPALADADSTKVEVAFSQLTGSLSEGERERISSVLDSQVSFDPNH